VTATADVHDVAAARLRRLDHRYSRGRRALVDVLESAEAPLSIPQLLGRDGALKQSSAYRNLAVLSIVPSGGSRHSTASSPITTGSTWWAPAPTAADGATTGRGDGRAETSRF
jgi:hypothetical protein